MRENFELPNVNPGCLFFFFVCVFFCFFCAHLFEWLHIVMMLFL